MNRWMFTGLLLLLLGGTLAAVNGLQLLKGTAATPTVLAAAKLRTIPLEQHMDSPLYLKRPKPGSRFGSLIIPSLSLYLPVYEGTDLPQLRQGVGHYPRSVLPRRA
ncbi:hypothetical protein [Ectobacillus ponti]|uniref:Uncharacterized protein n=1 Tax=Ectobacillus ponti TaxID=2961894 RepID=A0AA41XAH5_9BACI|nr:hypothetical protein [Ectobacillus ponti]MCP8969905.1 hypothetical protein [Ectobacillus ponti]